QFWIFENRDYELCLQTFFRKPQGGLFCNKVAHRKRTNGFRLAGIFFLRIRCGQKAHLHSEICCGRSKSAETEREQFSCNPLEPGPRSQCSGNPIRTWAPAKE